MKLKSQSKNRLSVFVILLFILSQLCLAQEEITVTSFLPAVSDLTARIDNRKDIDGNFCAVIKVIIPDQGVTFECGNIASMIIGEVSFRTNEYWVYLTAGRSGAKHLKIKHPKYPTIDVVFADYGFSTLEPQTTYVLKLQKPKEVNLEYKYNKTGAILSSTIIPGLGQMAFKKNYVKGAFICVGEAVAVSGIFICNNQSKKWKNKSDSALTAIDKKNWMAKSDDWTNGRNICIGIAGAIWAYNMVDVLFAKKKINKNSHDLSLHPLIEYENKYGITLTYNF